MMPAGQGGKPQAMSVSFANAPISAAQRWPRRREFGVGAVVEQQHVVLVGAEDLLAPPFRAEREPGVAQRRGPELALGDLEDAAARCGR